MSTQTRSILFTVALATSAPLLDAQAYAAFVFDRSGSMSQLRSGSSTSRAAFSQAVGIDDIGWFFQLNNVILNQQASCLVFEYHDYTMTQIGGVHTTAASAQAAVAALPAAGGVTPLAMALCEATAAVVALAPGAMARQRLLYVYSDGQENSSPATSCRAGLPAASGGDHCLQQWPGAVGAFSSGSWEEAVCNIIHASITTNFYYFSDFLDVVGPEAFFEALCDMTGGNLTRVGDGSTIPPQSAWRTYGQGCQDFHGTELSMTHAGLPQIGNTVDIGCRTSNPLPYVLGVGLNSRTFAGMPLPIDLTARGAPGCSLYTSWNLTEGIFPWGSVYRFSVPAAPAFVGLPLYFQAIQLHALNNPMGMATSNLLKMTIAP
ncbi:MAG: hypothetical protein KDC98_21195 [Planctomycetes bacterium]|nr:hypothetical protein [Planctomycetota bacterium]